MTECGGEIGGTLAGNVAKDGELAVAFIHSLLVPCARYILRPQVAQYRHKAASAARRLHLGQQVSQFILHQQHTLPRRSQYLDEPPVAPGRGACEAQFRQEYGLERPVFRYRLAAAYSPY